MDFSENAPVKKLSVENHEVYAGSAHLDFKESMPFQFHGI
jgi:choloylglycine hydrolase